MDWTTVISAFLGSQAFGAIIGGLITTGSNYIFEMQRRKPNELKSQRDSFAKEIQKRNEAYILHFAVKGKKANNFSAVDL
jgi:hypothetical protein